MIIVGSGISGLAAARELVERRYDVLILEARMRPGGRLRTVPMRILEDASKLGAQGSLVAKNEKGNNQSNKSYRDQTKSVVSNSASLGIDAASKAGMHGAAENGRQRKRRKIASDLGDRRTTRSSSLQSKRSRRRNIGVAAATEGAVRVVQRPRSAKNFKSTRKKPCSKDALSPLHPLHQQYTTDLFSQQPLIDENYRLVPVDVGGAFIHGTGQGRGATKATLNPLFLLTQSMGLPSVPLDGCTLMDANGNAPDPLLDSFVQDSFNKILDDCHQVDKIMKRKERGKGCTSHSLTLSDGTVVTPDTNFEKLFQSMAGQSKWCDKIDGSTDADHLFRWHQNNLEMSCGGPFSNLGLKWNADERYEYGGPHSVLTSGWGRVVEGMIAGNPRSSTWQGAEPIKIRYGLEVSGIRIMPPAGYDGDIVSDLEDEDDDLSDYHEDESSDDDKLDAGVGGEELDTNHRNNSASRRQGINSFGKSSSERPKKMVEKEKNPIYSLSSSIKTRSQSTSIVRRSKRSTRGRFSSENIYSPSLFPDKGRSAAFSHGAPDGSGQSAKKTTKINFTTRRQHLSQKRQLLSTLDPSSATNRSSVLLQTKSFTGESQTFEADHVIVTAPLGVLQSPVGSPGHITFVPPLPAFKREAIAKCGFGNYGKIALTFPRRFWSDRTINDDVTSGAKGVLSSGNDFWGLAGTEKLGGSILAVDLGRAHEKNVTGGRKVKKSVIPPVLLLIFGGDTAKDVERLTDEVAVGQTMDILRKAWGKDIPSPVDYLVTRWGEDVYARGSFSFVPPGVDGFVELNKIARPVYDPYPEVALSAKNALSSTNFQQTGRKASKDSVKRPVIMFAGEHTTALHPSTIHGAYLSGIREACRLDLSLESRSIEEMEFDRSDIFDRSFDVAAKKVQGKAKERKRKKAGGLDIENLVEDTALLRGAESYGGNLDGMAKTGEVMFPVPYDDYKKKGKRRTVKGMLRRYEDLVADGCNSLSTYGGANENDHEKEIWISADKTAEVFDWDKAAAVEAELQELL